MGTSQDQNDTKSAAPKLGRTIAKFVAGIIFIMSSFSIIAQGKGIGGFFFGLVIGGAFIAWGALPYVRERRAREEVEEKKRLEAELKHQAELKTVKKCPSCGAKTQGERCEYCGYPLY